MAFLANDKNCGLVAYPPDGTIAAACVLHGMSTTTPDGQAHPPERPTEDDIQRAKLGPRGVPGAPDPAKMTPQNAKNTPKTIDPGHTA